MPFRFPLESVFRLRQSLERQQELRLRAANQQVFKVKHIIEQLDQQLSQAQRQASKELNAGTTAAEVRFTLEKQSTLDNVRHDLERELARLSNLRDQQQRIFQEARRQRETFESLRDQQLREYERDQSRLEQRRLDDLFLLRRAYQQRG
jgi:flagellar export protein FliJ